jgi:alkylation response protein AidB-like acyl-CoA dehydrogenase
MALSEPHAGSSLGDITTRAVPAGDGTYRLHGSKMWISAAEHDLSENIVNLVLAKLPDAPPGVKGISLFIVPKFLVEAGGARGRRNGVHVTDRGRRRRRRAEPGGVRVFAGLREGTPAGTPAHRQGSVGTAGRDGERTDKGPPNQKVRIT